MENEVFSEIEAKIKKLERQNIFLKIFGLIIVLVFGFAFVSHNTTAQQTEITAQKFKIVSPDGKNCGFLGFDPKSKNAQLSMTLCGGTNPEVKLFVDENNAVLNLNVGNPMAILQATRKSGMSSLQLQSEPGTPGGTYGVSIMESGNKAVPPHLILDGRDKGRMEFFLNSNYLKVEDDGRKTRMAIFKPHNDNLAIQFYSKFGIPNHTVSPEASKKKR